MLIRSAIKPSNLNYVRIMGTVTWSEWSVTQGVKQEGRWSIISLSSVVERKRDENRKAVPRLLNRWNVGLGIFTGEPANRHRDWESMMNESVVVATLPAIQNGLVDSWPRDRDTQPYVEKQRLAWQTRQEQGSPTILVRPCTRIKLFLFDLNTWSA